jgi:hypothetical protein
LGIIFLGVTVGENPHQFHFPELIASSLKQALQHFTNVGGAKLVGYILTVFG